MRQRGQRMRSVTRWLGALAAVAVVWGSAPASAENVGVKILGVVWNPAMPDQQGLRELLNQPTAVTDAVSNGWRQSREQTCEQLKADLGKGDKFARGVTLYNITCTLGEQGTLTLESGGSSPRFKYVVPGNYLEFTSTQPTVFGSYADPRFSIAYDLHVRFQVAIQHTDPPLRVLSAVGEVVNARADSHGFVGDVVKLVVDLFTGPGFSNLVANHISGPRVNLTNTINAQLGPINALLRPPAGMVWAGHWARRNTVILAFAPANMTPNESGWVTGTIRWKKKDAGNQKPECEQVSLAASVQVGPAALLDPDTGSTGAAPTKTVGAMRFNAPLRDNGDTYECPYSLASLALGIPNAVTGKAAGGRGGNTFLVTGLRVKPVGWNGTVTPTPGASGKDFEVDSYIASTGVGVINKERLVGPKNPGDADPTRVQKARPGVIQQRDILQQSPAQRRLPAAGQGVR